MSEADDDSESAMREMMGFSKFGMQRPTEMNAIGRILPAQDAIPATKKAKTYTKSFDPSRIATSGTSQADPASRTQDTSGFTSTRSTRYVPQTADRTIPVAATMLDNPAHPQASHAIQSSSAFISPASPAQYNRQSSSSVPSSTKSDIAYVNPATGYTLTRAELFALSRGKVNERGDIVYFKPGFVEENPWQTLEEKIKEQQSIQGEG